MQTERHQTEVDNETTKDLNSNLDEPEEEDTVLNKVLQANQKRYANS